MDDITGAKMVLFTMKEAIIACSITSCFYMYQLPADIKIRRRKLNGYL